MEEGHQNQKRNNSSGCSVPVKLIIYLMYHSIIASSHISAQFVRHTLTQKIQSVAMFY